uniref:Uncharacterized protein n=1 Tax=viral metagenome TaxID=1070528 RepID=A0A6M3IZE9_9ZZZZ
MTGPAKSPKVNLEGDTNRMSSVEWVIQCLKRAGADEEYVCMVRKEAEGAEPHCCLDVLGRYVDLRINDII